MSIRVRKGNKALTVYKQDTITVLKQALTAWAINRPMRTKDLRPARLECNNPRFVCVGTSNRRSARDADIVRRRSSIAAFIEACKEIEVSTSLRYK